MNILLLDRDGTIIADPDDERVDSVDKIKLFPDTIEALQYLAKHDFAVVLITNQASIAEERLTEAGFWHIQDEVLRQLEPSGIQILKTYMNGEAPGPGASEQRKRGPGMLLQAAADLDFNISTVYMAGDRATDVQAAINAGCKGGILVKTARVNVDSPDAIYTAPSLMDAARYVVANS